MDKDRQAVKLTIEAICKEAILGIFGTDEEQTSINKLHTALDFADKLRIQEGEVTISLKDLKKAKKEYEKEMTNDE